MGRYRRGRGGRPPVPELEKRNQRVQFRVSDEQWRLFLAAKQLTGMWSSSLLLHLLAFGKPLTTANESRNDFMMWMVFPPLTEHCAEVMRVVADPEARLRLERAVRKVELIGQLMKLTDSVSLDEVILETEKKKPKIMSVHFTRAELAKLERKGVKRESIGKRIMQQLESQRLQKVNRSVSEETKAQLQDAASRLLRMLIEAGEGHAPHLGDISWLDAPLDAAVAELQVEFQSNNAAVQVSKNSFIP